MKKSVDLVATIEAAGVELRRQGKRHVGRCPFHDDRHPSLFVFPDGHFKCFGCGAHGDAVDFVQMIHGCNFREALKILGIADGPISAERRAEINRQKEKSCLVKTFRQWERDTAHEVAFGCRVCRRHIDKIRTEADLEKYGDLYHSLQLYEYHLDILTSGDDEAKFRLFEAQYYGI
ncbi:MAG: CHC2 zinc finger domain-containing protein [Thermodesulfobacteriota bacterium]|nr:CHC2 zinc finger domain-containing protein [Thermodesulfobacteriota bacterium]